MRLFIAIPLPKPILRACLEARRQLLAAATKARPVPEGNFHITLHFIGENDNIAGAAAACKQAVRGFRPISLRLEGYGAFGRAGAQTGYLEVQGDLMELKKLYESLEAALIEEGFAAGRGRFTPHVTLARAVDLPESELSLELPDTAFVADRIVLYESVNAAGRTRYDRLHEERL